jgi:hypothetical protein
MAVGAAIFAGVEGNSTMLESDVPAKLKQFNAQVAIEAQSPMALSQGLVLGGQQSMSSMADVEAISVGLTLRRALAAAGSIATDRAIRPARMVRPMLMVQDSRTRIAGSLVLGSSDDFAMSHRQSLTAADAGMIFRRGRALEEAPYGKF